MAQQKETRFKQMVYQFLDKIPCLWYTKIQQVAIRGIPDLLLCYRGHFIAWELKVDDNKADALQEYTLAKITQSGGIARVVTPDNILEAIEELKNVDQKFLSKNDAG